jgi:hypothetical protein
MDYLQGKLLKYQLWSCGFRFRNNMVIHFVGTTLRGTFIFVSRLSALILTAVLVWILQVAFRAKVGKRYQLPHRGIIPEEFGVVCC